MDNFNHHKILEYRPYKKYLVSPTPFKLAQLKNYRNKLNVMTLLLRPINCILNNNKNKNSSNIMNLRWMGVLSQSHNWLFFFSEFGPTLASMRTCKHSPLYFMNSPINENFHFLLVPENEVQEIIINLKDSSPGYDWQ